MHSITRTLSFTGLILASSLSWAAEPAPAAQPVTAEEKTMHEHSRKHGKRQEHMQERMQERLKAMDSNSDGNISKAEFQANADKHFQQMDSNNDGKISAQERSEVTHSMFKTPTEAVPAPKSPAPSKN